MKKFFKTLIVYFFGNAFSRLVSFVFLLPLQTKYCSDAQIGTVDLINTLITVIIPVLCIEVWTGILRYIYDYKSLKNKERVISTGLIINLMCFILFTLCFLLASVIFHIPYAIYIYFFAVGYMLNSTWSYIARGLGYNTVYVFSGAIGSILSLILHLTLLATSTAKVESLLLCYTASYLGPFLFMECFVRVHRRFSPKKVNGPLFKQMLLFCLPLSVNSVSYWLTNSFNRVVIRGLLGPSMNGQFAIASKFTMIIMLIVTVFNLAWAETAYAMNSDKERAKKYSMVLKYYNRFIGCGVLLLIPFTLLIFPWMIRGGDYSIGKEILPTYYLATFLSTLASFMGGILQAEKDTKFLFSSAMWGSGVSVVSLLTLMPLMQKFTPSINPLYAATVSLLLSFGITAALRVRFSKRTMGVRFDYRFLFAYLPVFLVGWVIFQTGILWLNLVYFLLAGLFALFLMREMIGMVFSRVTARFKR